MPQQTQKRAATVHHKRRTGQHHKKGSHYLKTYWPYIPISLIVALGLFLGSWQPTTRNGVLAYATEMSITTLLDSTNQQRAKNGEKPLKLNTKLTNAAQSKANDMTARNYWSHNTPDGRAPWTFVQTANYSYQKAGENLAYGFNSSSETIVGWMNSPSHRENLLDNDYTEVGFGFANAKDFNHAGPETVVVAMYGTPYAGEGAEGTAKADANPLTSQTLGANEPQQLAVSRLQLFTDGSMPWITFAVGLLSGALLVLILLKHGLAFRRLVTRGEAFIIKHPVLDIAVVALVMTGYVLSRGTGVIR